MVLLSAVWPAFNAFADNVQFLQLNMKDKCISVALAGHPTIYYVNNQLQIVTPTQSINIEVANLIDYTFSNTETAIHELKLSNTSISDGLLVVSGLKPNTIVTLTAINGKQLLQTKASPEGLATINMRQHPKGMYILSTANTVIKITNKK